MYTHYTAEHSRFLLASTSFLWARSAVGCLTNFKPNNFQQNMTKSIHNVYTMYVCRLLPNVAPFHLTFHVEPFFYDIVPRFFFRCVCLARIIYWLLNNAFIMLLGKYCDCGCISLTFQLAAFLSLGRWIKTNETKNTLRSTWMVWETSEKKTPLGFAHLCSSANIAKLDDIVSALWRGTLFFSALSSGWNMPRVH